jgi:hypothetical protein
MGYSTNDGVVKINLGSRNTFKKKGLDRYGGSVEGTKSKILDVLTTANEKLSVHFRLQVARNNKSHRNASLSVYCHARLVRVAPRTILLAVYYSLASQEHRPIPAQENLGIVPV